VIREKRDLAITGMTCASCVVSVESALRSVSGVASADVNLATERATVRLDVGTDLGGLVRAVERAGYGALPIPSDGDRTGRGSAAEGVVAEAIDLNS
jgi:Cu+-exporting ATPase